MQEEVCGDNIGFLENTEQTIGNNTYVKEKHRWSTAGEKAGEEIERISCLELEIELSKVTKQRIKIHVKDDKYEVTVMLPKGPLRKTFSEELSNLDMYGTRPVGLDEFHFTREVTPTNIGRFVHEYHKLVTKYKEPLQPSFTSAFFLSHQRLRAFRFHGKQWDKQTPYAAIDMVDVAIKPDIYFN